MRRGLGAPVIDLDESELEEILAWVEVVKYRALVRKSQELAELGLRTFLMPTTGERWRYTHTSGYLTIVRRPESRETYSFTSYDRSQSSNRTPGEKWRNRKPPGKPATEFEHVGTYRLLGIAQQSPGDYAAFISEDIDLNSLIPTRSEYDALAVGVGELSE